MDYAKISSKFWSGSTGRAIRGDTNAQIVALYLLTSPHANGIGVFHCPPLYISYETGIPLEGALKGLERLSEVGFLTLDKGSEWVWIHEMLSYQMGDDLKPNDNRIKHIIKLYHNIPESLIKSSFYEKYKEKYLLNLEAPLKPLISPFEANNNNNNNNNSNNNNNKKEKNIKKENPDFDAFWKAYPRKTAKKNAEQAWKKVSTPLDTILNAIERQKKTQQWTKDNGAFIPHPATWLNQERWNDQLEFKQENNLGKYV